MLSPRITASDSGFLSAKNTGLGNVLFQLASCYGLAKKTRRKPVWNKLVDFKHQLKHLFNYDHGTTIFRNFTEISNTHFLSINENNPWEYDNILIKHLESNNMNYELYGYFECIDYFHEYKPEITQLFSIDELTLSVIQSQYPILFDKEKTMISIHFRGNEYLTHSAIGVPWDYDYYRRAVQYFKDHMVNPVFLIFSDDMDKINFSFLGDLPYHKITNKDYVELWCQSLCNHNIISHSTFSFWGAYLNTSPNSITLYNKNKTKAFHKYFQAI